MSELTDERLDEIEALAAARTGDDYYCPSCRSAVVATYDERCCSCGSNAYVPDDDPLCVAVPELAAEIRRLKALDIDTAFCWHCKHVTSEFAFVCPECMDLVKRLKAHNERLAEWEPMLEHIDVNNREINISASTRIVQVMAEEFMALMEQEGAENYVEWGVLPNADAGLPQFTVLIQRKDGLTPAQKNTKLEAEKLRARELYENAARDTLAFTAAIDPDGPTLDDVMQAYDEALQKERV